VLVEKILQALETKDGPSADVAVADSYRDRVRHLTAYAWRQFVQ
jgi:hypothetical protein